MPLLLFGPRIKLNQYWDHIYGLGSIFPAPCGDDNDKSSKLCSLFNSGMISIYCSGHKKRS